MNRREFLQFLGTTGTLSSIAGCGHFANFSSEMPLIESLTPSMEDKLLTLPGINSHILLRWGDQLHQGKYFGYNNDFIALHKLNHDHYVMWVNHEYVNPLFVSGIERTKSHIDLERKEVGGSIVEIKRTDGIWKTIKDSPYNRRIDATTPIPFAWKDKISGSHSGIGTLGNCAGGKTPWGTFLTCEENYDMFYGDRDRKGKKLDESWLKWDKFYPMPPEHYGWVVEINPKTGESKKLISLGRCAHECAAVTRSKNGKIVAYTGDDSNDEHLYKFISDSDHSLEKGKLYVANLELREWISLQREDHQILLHNFKDQTEIQIYAREAAKLVGATPLARPEDIEFDPLTGDVLIALTNNKPKNNFHGSILKISENGNDPGSLKFSYDTFLTGGENQGFSCPDNMVFDKSGNLWFTTDMAGNEMNKGHYKSFGNNGLFVFLRTGRQKGEIIKVASAPIDAEFTGPCFTEDYKTLFLSVQHPGEFSPNAQNPTSRWPDGDKPKPSVVALEGELINKIVEGKC